MSSEENESIISVCVNTSPFAEDLVSALLESVFKSTPSVWSDLDANKSKVTVYLEREDITKIEEELIRQGINAIDESGFDVGEGVWEITPVKREDWSQSWKRHFHPIEVSNRLLVKPEWEEVKAKSGQIVVTLNPGLSFGTGHHPTTLFCLKQLAEHAPNNEQRSFLDAGSGSGILAISAAKLGFSQVVAWDFDPQAVRVARENAKQNNLDGELSFDVKDLTQMTTGGQKFDVICANLIYDLLIDESEKLISWTASDGCLILAGILKEQFSLVRDTFCRAGMKMIDNEVCGEWCSGVFRFNK
ncbi:MAG: 50S ribosomal protein L11 methyltransferase [Verrucomicrobiales bacterium]|nr:50S ribosomal protein L11 methyltransferase [Verrucomicrobiales bacterium]